VSSASIDLPVERGYSAVAGQQTLSAADRLREHSDRAMEDCVNLSRFEGPPDAMLRYELDTVKPIMELMHAVGCDPAPVVMEGARKSVEWLGARTSLAAPGANRLSEPAR